MVRDDATIKRDAEMWALVAELEALKTEREAMVAENMQRAACNNVMAYDDSVFMGVAQRMRDVASQLCNI